VRQCNSSHRTIGNGKELSFDSAETKLHETEIDYRCGLFRRYTDYGPVRLRTERFVSMADCHLMADRLEMEAAEAGIRDRSEPGQACAEGIPQLAGPCPQSGKYLSSFPGLKRDPEISGIQRGIYTGIQVSGCLPEGSETVPG
jgi:hypothetical protein